VALTAIVNASIKCSALWNHIRLLHLKQNMCLDRTPESNAFAAWLLDVGAGRGLGPSKTIKLPPNMQLPDNSVKSLVNAIYPNITHGNKPDDYFLQRTILSPKNDTVDDVNQSILDSFPGEQTTTISVDKVIGIENIYPVEFLHSLKASGLPLAHLNLKPGVPLMLLRNLDVSNGLCNGTRMILLAIKPRVLQCHILGGKHAGNIVFIPRITIEPSAEDMPLPLSRRQFPVRLAFSMTINKSQGQSVTHVGLDLRIPVFSHGQLYVALSRCTSGNRIKAIFPDGSNDSSTTNIVYPEMLTNILDPWCVVSFINHSPQLTVISSL
jgi:PIF1-like helicase